MWVYLDTSALLKLYIVEAWHADLQGLCANAEALAVSRMAWVEACSGLARRIRETPADRPALEQARHALAAEWAGYRIVEVTPGIVDRAAQFVDAFALRAYDAVQLASARELALAADEPVVFACFDRRLNRAAQVLGLEVPFAQEP